MIPLKIHHEKKVAVVPDMKGVGRLIPHARRVVKNGSPYLIVPAGRDELMVLRNLGFAAPTPLDIDYDWAGNTPFDAQVGTTDLLIHNPRAYVLNDMGTGKTLSTLFAFDYLRRKGTVNKMLVIAPLSTLSTVWEREVFSRMGHMSAVSLHGSADKRRKLLKQDHQVYIINHHGVATIIDDIIKANFDVVVIDELAIYRTKSTGLWKAAHKVIQGRKFVWGLTGSPTPKEPADAWAQIHLITPARTTAYYKQFRELTMKQITQFKWIPKREANDIVLSHMQPAVRYDRSACVDLPPTTFTTIEAPLSDAQIDVYKALKDHYYAKFLEGEVTVANEGVLVSKLMQVSCGFAYTKDRKVKTFDHKKKMAELTDVLDQAKNKVIVFTPFVESVRMLFGELSNGGYDVRKVYGDTPKAERDEIFNEFQHGLHPRIIVAHPQCMAHGLTLTSADTIVWFCPPQSLEIYEQANARITRPGQKHNTLIVHMASTPVEKKIYQRLQARAELQGALLDLFAEENPTIGRAQKKT